MLHQPTPMNRFILWDKEAARITVRMECTWEKGEMTYPKVSYALSWVYQWNPPNTFTILLNDKIQYFGGKEGAIKFLQDIRRPDQGNFFYYTDKDGEPFFLVYY